MFNTNSKNLENNEKYYLKTKNPVENLYFVIQKNQLCLIENNYRKSMALTISNTFNNYIK